MANSTELKLLISAQDNASQKLRAVGAETEKMSGAMGKVATAAKLATVAVGALAVKVGVDAVKSAAVFDKSMANVSTLVDTTKENMTDMKNEVLKLSRDLPVALDDLTSSLYDIRSAGISAKDAMNVLTYSAKLSVAGLSTASEATDVMTSALNAFKSEGLDASTTADIFFKAVKAGKTTVSDLAQGFGQVAPLSAQAGVSLEELLATTAAFTTTGMDASIAYTQLRTALSSMLKPTKEMQDAMDIAGISSDNLSQVISEEGLTGTVRKLSDAVGGNQSQLAKMFGSVEALNAVMLINGEVGNNAIEINDNMRNGTEELTGAFEKQNQEASAQYQILKNNLNVELINLGNKILPVLVEALKWTRENWESLKKPIEVIINAVKAFEKANEEMFYTVITGFNKFNNILDGAFKAWDNLTQHIIKNPINAVIDIVQKVTNKKKALGGAVTAGAPYIVGEYRPEVFVPSQSGNIRQLDQVGGKNVTINFTNAVVRDEADIDEIARRVEMVLNRKQELAGLGAY